MGKPIKCRVKVHGLRREIDWGEFPSIAEAKRALRYWRRPYTIIKLKNQ